MQLQDCVTCSVFVIVKFNIVKQRILLFMKIYQHFKYHLLHLRHWARSILNKFSIKRSQSYSHRPIISGPCGFVSDPYSTVLNDAHSLVPGVGLERSTEAEHNSVSSKLSSFNGSGNNVLLLGNV